MSQEMPSAEKAEVIEYIIVTHVRPHLDKLFALFLAIKYGEDKFPGIEKAKITFIFLGTGGEEFQRLPEQFCRERRFIFLGIGPKQFNEHPGTRITAQEGECCATLMAKYLGVENNPELAKLLRFVSVTDRKTGRQPFDIASLTMSLYRKYKDPLEAIKVALDIVIGSFYGDQVRFWQTSQEFDANAKVEEISSSGSKPLVVVTIRSDNEMMQTFARGERGASAVIQQTSTGNVQIYTDERVIKLRRTNVIPNIRNEERRLKGTTDVLRAETLLKAGRTEGAEEWYLPQVDSQVFLNGSLSAPDVPPTKIPLEKITEIVKNAFHLC